MKYFWDQIAVHWSATDYEWLETGDYHEVINVVNGNATLHKLTDINTPLFASTYGRNHNTISLSFACMSPVGGTWASPPTEHMLDVGCKRLAELAILRGWPADQLERKIMTHAEMAALRDYPRGLVEAYSNKAPSSSWDHLAQAAGLPHANYGPSSWHDGWPGGDVVRWDLWQLKPSDQGGIGGHLLRVGVAEWMAKLEAAK
jgi:hypothetical protein